MRSDESALLEDLYGGVYEQPLWGRFLTRLCDTASYAGLVLRPAHRKPLELYAGKSAAHIRRIFAEQLDRPPQRAPQMREGRVYALEELVHSSAGSQRQVYNELELALGPDVIRVMRVSEPGGVDIWLSCAGRRQSSGALSARMSSLAPHLRAALRSLIKIDRERLRLGATAEALDQLGFAWILLDAQCRITDLAPRAQRFMASSGLLGPSAQDRLLPASPGADRALTALVRQYADNPDSPPRVIGLSSDPPVDLLVRPVAERAFATHNPPVATAYIQTGRAPPGRNSACLVELFGLLPSEARFAWELAQGSSIAEAATRLGLTIESARNCSKKIYAKTGTSGQTELVHTLLTSVVTLA